MALAVACGGSPTTPITSTQPCNLEYDCPSGETCWTTDDQTFTCMPAGKLEAGAACASAPGLAICAEGLACVATGHPADGKCEYWCDATDPCPSGTCVTMTDTNSVRLSYCDTTP